jgi:hypothetical protein
VTQSRSDKPAPANCTASELFDLLWATLTDVIGPTATAALLQRSIKRAAEDQPELRELVIGRDQFVYTYKVPPSWTRPEPTSRPALTRVVRELWPLLSDLTGPVVVRRLSDVPLLRRCGVIPKDGGR